MHSTPPLITAGPETTDSHGRLLEVVFLKIHLRFLMTILNKGGTKPAEREHGAESVNWVNTTLTMSRPTDEIANVCNCSTKCLDFSNSVESFLQWFSYFRFGIFRLCTKLEWNKDGSPRLISNINEITWKITRVTMVCKIRSWKHAGES